jgi:hypothetical protein
VVVASYSSAGFLNTRLDEPTDSAVNR